MNRVAVTGLGAISAAGATADETWASLLAGKSAIGPLECSRRELVSCPVAAQIKDFDSAAHFPTRVASTLDRVAQLAVVAAREAAADSGLRPEAGELQSASCILGVGVGGLHTLDDGFHRLYREGSSRVHPLTIPKLMVNAAPSRISTELGLKGMTYAVASACASSNHAVGMAFRSIRTGETAIAITGGAESCITAGTMIAWEGLRVLSFETCRPFARNRSGLVIGEGAGVMVLENMDHALARGARIYGEICGFGANADAGDLTSPDQENTARAMQLALSDARMQPAEVGYVNAHGTGTMINDAVECSSIHQVFEGAPSPLVSSSKAVIGHCMGAAGGLEAIATVLALHHQVVPPTANCEEPDTGLGLDFVAGGARATPLNAAISSSFAFGGLNAVLAFRRFAVA